jgi:hypothetical protein
MRVAGFIFLFAGFFWLVLVARLGIPVAAKNVLYEHCNRLPISEARTYSRSDVQQHMQDVLSETLRRFPSIMYGSLSMLIGGLLFASAPRRTTNGTNVASQVTD